MNIETVNKALYVVCSSYNTEACQGRDTTRIRADLENRLERYNGLGFPCRVYYLPAVNRYRGFSVDGCKRAVPLRLGGD